MLYLLKMTQNSNSEEINGDVIGLDIGAKRIGVARINTTAKIAEPLKPILTDKQETFTAVLMIAAEYSAQCIVLGLPRGLDGQETSQTAEIRGFAEKLSVMTTLPIYLIDEAGTTKEAENRSKSNPDASIDSLAATIILEDFINYSDKAALEFK